MIPLTFVLQNQSSKTNMGPKHDEQKVGFDHRGPVLASDIQDIVDFPAVKPLAASGATKMARIVCALRITFAR
jgi:hypothetical protein